MKKLDTKVDKYLNEMCEKLDIKRSTILDIPDTFPNPLELMGIPLASDLLLGVILNGEGLIVLNCDYDLDGITSGAINYNMLRGMGVNTNRLVMLQNKREWGNGFNDKAMTHLHTMVSKGRLIDMMITSDHGSGDEVRYKLLRKLIPKIKLVVTDHHLIPANVNPITPDAFVNPQQANSDPRFVNLSGGVVTWWLMLATLAKLRKTDWVGIQEEPIRNVEPLAALTTVCDQMNMLDPINRTIVKQGVKTMNSSDDLRWKALKSNAKSRYYTDTDLSFKFGPLMNSTGRMGSPMTGHLFLTSVGRRDIYDNFAMMVDINSERKQWMALVESDLERQFYKLKKYKRAKILAHDEDITGISGPLASSFSPKVEVPVIVLSNIPGTDTYKGSCRTFGDVHIFNVLKAVNADDPTVLIKFGGHHGAAGVELHLDKLERFRELMEIHTPIPNAVTASEIDVGGDLSMATYESISQLAPFGNHWKAPVVKAEVYVRSSFFTRDRKHVIYNLASSKEESINGFHYLSSGVCKSAGESMTITTSPDVHETKNKKVLKVFISGKLPEQRK